MRLPTVRVWDSKKRRERVFDARAYALGGRLLDPRFRVLGEKRGEAPDAEIAHQVRQAGKEAARAADPSRPAHGDAERAFAARQGRVVLNTETPQGDESWRSMKWFSARRYIKDRTGILPDSKRHAEQIMRAYARGELGGDGA